MPDSELNSSYFKTGNGKRQEMITYTKSPSARFAFVLGVDFSHTAATIITFTALFSGPSERRSVVYVDKLSVEGGIKYFV